VQRINAISGASSAHLDVPIQRFLRDASTLANHAVLGYEANLTLLGKELLGLDPQTPFLQRTGGRLPCASGAPLRRRDGRCRAVRWGIASPAYPQAAAL
jgi:hypothetical protein